MVDKKENNQKRKEKIDKKTNRPRRPTAKPSSTEKFEKVEYKIQKYTDVTIKVYRSFFHVKVAVWFKSSFFNRRNWRDSIQLKDSRTDITITFCSKQGFDKCYRRYGDEEFIVVESLYVPFNDTVNLSDQYVSQPDFIRVNKAREFAVKIDAYVNKWYYIPESANASYETMQKQQFEHTSITNPLQEVVGLVQDKIRRY